ncbi:agmatine deiminase family protein, partial [Streptacidiphilus pinicola]
MSTTPTPASLGWSMPAEWAAHDRTWMAFPTSNETFAGDELHLARQAWANGANTIVRSEPVTLGVNTGAAEAARG